MRGYGKLNGVEKAIFAHGTSSARGIAMFVSKEFFSRIKNIYKGEDGRTLICDIHEDVHIITLVAIYAPNEDSPGFFNKLREILRNRHENKVVVGDFNLALNVEVDRKNTYFNNNRAKDQVLDIMEEFSLNDTWRVRNPEKLEYSWTRKTSRSHEREASRIDFALVSAGLDQKVEMIMYISSIKTDHRAVYMVINTMGNERGPGYWKFNTRLLQDSQYLETMNKQIEAFIADQSGDDPCAVWEKFKGMIKKTTVKFCRRRTDQDKLILSQLCEKVKEYESRLPLQEREDKLYVETKAEFEDKIMEKTLGVMFRCKANWYEYGEQNTKYFYSLEKAKYNSKTCFRLVTEQGQELRDDKEILNYQREFYVQLYDKDPEVHFDMQNRFNVKVPENIREEQESQITRIDLEEAIKTMNNNKTPGKDGIPVDFYKVFWARIKNLFYDMMLHAFDLSLLPLSLREGVLNLIPKANKDSRMVKNLRPITLLNTDYKIIEKAIANKMIPALTHIIHQDQRGFMKDRRISVNIRKMLDIIHQAEKEDLEAVVLSLDFVKCFDKCSFSILHGSLDFFGFGQIVKDWTKILYDQFFVCIQNNGKFSTQLPIKKGVHQGGCCSSVYFLVIAEILALSLRSNEEIEGITIRDIRNLLNQFADDMDIFSSNSKSSLENIKNELESFRLQSGFTVSYDKTTMYRIGSLRHSNTQMYDLDQFVWSNEDINVLGVTIAHEEVVQKNYQPLVEKSKKVLDSWYNRGLSLIGKVQVVNTLIASLFVYKMMVLPIIPDNIVKKIDNLIRNFLWNGKKSKVGYNILQNPTEAGGLKLVNLVNKDKALKTTWPQILAKENSYGDLVYSLMRCTHLKENIWRCNLHKADIDKFKAINKFWRDVLVSWSEINVYFQFRIENQIIWYNSKIRVNNKPFFWKDIFDSGLVYVYQLFDHKEFKTDEQVRSEFGLSRIRYNSIKAAIPREWKLFFRENPTSTFLPLPPHNYDQSIHVYKGKWARKVYLLLSDDVLLVHNKYLKWKMDLGEDFNDSLVEFGTMHLDVYKLTNVPKLRSFQYRINQHALVTNVQLYKWNIVGSEACSFCGKDKETVLHIFVECDQVRTLWNQLSEYTVQLFPGTTLHITPTNIIFNRIGDGKRNVINFICLLVKQYIYSQRCLKSAISFPIFKNRLMKIRSIEKYIAIKNGKLHLHNKKWYKTTYPDLDGL